MAVATEHVLQAKQRKNTMRFWLIDGLIFLDDAILVPCRAVDFAEMTEIAVYWYYSFPSQVALVWCDVERRPGVQWQVRSHPSLSLSSR
jgi:hypothetical protein